MREKREKRTKKCAAKKGFQSEVEWEQMFYTLGVRYKRKRML